MKKNKGITLISLVITIIILIILASVAIYMNLGENGIFIRSKEAKEVTNKQTATEIINLKITTAQMNKYAETQEMPTLKELSLVLKDDDEIQYVTEKSKVASVEYDVPNENPTSIYTKLNKYPYEFEINGQLQLASIDGVKVANSNTQSINGPTGIKTDTYIRNYTNTTNANYTGLTSMSGLTNGKDENNKIDEYLSYSNQDGYTVLKTGWYFIDLYTMVYATSGYATTNLFLIVNEATITSCRCAAKTDQVFGINTFPIFLNQGDKIYFSSSGGDHTAGQRMAQATLYPMF